VLRLVDVQGVATAVALEGPGGDAVSECCPACGGLVKVTEATFYPEASVKYEPDTTEVERLKHPSGRDSYPCQRCGVVYGMDASLPNSEWQAVTDGKWEILCLWCIDALAVEQGVKYTAYLYFVGLAGQSALYEGDKDERWPEIVAERDGVLISAGAEVERLRALLLDISVGYELTPKLAERVREALG